jgi:hypothetical protein
MVSIRMDLPTAGQSAGARLTVAILNSSNAGRPPGTWANRQLAARINVTSLDLRTACFTDILGTDEG